MMSKQIEEGNAPQQYTKTFDMEKYAFIAVFPFDEKHGEGAVNGGAIATVWQNVADQPEVVAATLRKLADALEFGDSERSVRPFGQGRG